MNRIRKAVIVPTLAALLPPGGIAFSQDHHDDNHHDDHHDNHAYVHHEEWKHGYHMRHEDWDRGERVDYHRYHLQEPHMAMSGVKWTAITSSPLSQPESSPPSS